MKKMNKILGLIVALFIANGAMAQETPISNTTLEACGGFLVDTGLSASDYGNNENFTMTICAEDPETIVNLHFNLFGLGTGDSMTIYDGSDDTAPLIGVYEDDDLIGQDVTSTNGDGCLTIVWVTDASDVGNFTAEISCGLPCEQPQVNVNVDQSAPYQICVGEELTFDASSTVFANGTALGEFTWLLGDETENNTDWPAITHSYDEPGGYIVNLLVTDDNECESTNFVDILVQVSTTPTITVPSDMTICPGDDPVLLGQVEGTFWDGSVGGISGGELFIPDDQTTCFESEIIFSGFAPGATIDEVSDFESFFINFEHSFMGDLTITFECPEGNTIAVHQQGGGGTQLGEPVDIDTDLTPGVGYDYWWSPASTNGTWADEGFGTLPSGTYDSAQDWDALLGCSLNGAWSIEICDSWGSDNGYIFDWTVTFAEEFYDVDMSFTPEFDASCIGTSWSAGGPGEVLSADCNELTITADVPPGVHEYTFSATDNFGCTYSDNVTVTVLDPPPSFTLEGDFFCLTDDDYYITPVGSANPGQYDWEWNDGSSGTSILYTGPGEYSFTVENVCGTDEGGGFFEGVVCEITIPDIFTPDNGDEFNENFHIDGLEYFPGSALTIFNRWGKKIYESDDYQNDWNPTADEAAEGTYYYVLEMLNADAEIEEHAGYFAIVRK